MTINNAKNPGQAMSDASKMLDKHINSKSVTLLLGMAIVGAIAYLAFLLNPHYRGDLLPYAIVIISEVYLIVYGIVSFWTVLNGRINPRKLSYYTTHQLIFGSPSSIVDNQIIEDKAATAVAAKQMYIHHKPVTVDVFIPVYGEALEEIAATAKAAKAMHGRHETYILDDGDSDEVQALAKSLAIGYIRRPEHNHAKAGNINYALGKTTGDYFVILDADFVADQHFLTETMAFFEDEKMAFVQTPQFYGNYDNFVSTGAGFMQHVFYALVQAGKNRFNAAFCVGTNVVFRRSAIMAIGGIYQDSKSEDIWTSLRLHEKGYHSIYINKVLAIGKAPDTIKAYAKQQLRWATGSFEIFLKANPLFNTKLTLSQRLQYLVTTAFYFNGFAVAGLLILPILQIFFDLTPVNLQVPFMGWLLLYTGFYATQLMLSMLTMGGLKYQTLLLSTVSFPIYVKAFFNALRNRDVAWEATNQANSYDSAFNYIKVQMYTLGALAITSVVGIIKSIYLAEFSVAIIWSVINTILFALFIYTAHTERRIHMTQKPSNMNIHPVPKQSSSQIS